MKVLLMKFAKSTVEVELPDACPKCDLAFNEVESLAELQLMPQAQSCQIHLGEICNYGSAEPADDGTEVVGYACTSCGVVLVSTEEDNVPSVPAAAPDPAAAQAAVLAIRELLWPGGDEDAAEWSGETADTISHILRNAGIGPVAS